jgi:hypothetical protein
VIDMPTGWKILDQTQILDIGPDGKASDAIAVEYANAADTIHGRLVVPLNDNTATEFSQLFAARVAVHEAIASA